MRVRYLTLILMWAIWLPVALCAQERVGGVLQTEDSIPVIGASVSIQGTTAGTMTDAEGRFEIQADANAVLVIAYKGYETRVIPVAELAGSLDKTILLKQPRSAMRMHRGVVWGTFGVSSPLEAFTVSGKFGSYSYAGGGLGIGYQFYYKHLLLTTGIEVQSLNYKMEYASDALGSSANGSIGFDVRRLQLQVPVLAGMEYPWWYWQAGAKLAFMDHYYIFNKHEDIRTQETVFAFLCSPEIEAGVNINTSAAVNCKLAVCAEANMKLSQKTTNMGWWLIFLLGIKCTVAF